MPEAEQIIEPRCGMFILIPVFKLKADWGNVDCDARARAAEEATQVLQIDGCPAEANIYISRGLNASSDYFLRVRAQNLLEAQKYLHKWLRTRVGQLSDLTDIMVGVTKPLHYITHQKSAQLNDQLKRLRYEGGKPGFVVIIPVKKCAKWWALSDAERLKEIEVHTRQSVAYLAAVNRELYHSTGLDQADFITYFETNDLKAFHELAIALTRIPEYEFQVPSGHALLLGTIHPIADAVRMLC